jgi:uncharacterized membrane protein
MNVIVRVIKAIYNFLVGDMIILVGICIAVVLLTLINFVSGLRILSALSGTILIVAILASLTATLAREARGKR